jgi:2-polyprenyl-3-methyl-5-hydroxy-6-metoxy-1,4-benzoquinol methylase
MSTEDTDRFWQALGERDPYWGVLTGERFRSDNLTADTLEDIYASGERQLDLLLQTIRRYVDDRFAPASALDFGCGVGRLGVALARRCRRVVGVGVSDGMLGRAWRTWSSSAATTAWRGWPARST